RREVQAAAFEAITRYLSQYEVETKGVYIQDVAFPQGLVVVLTQREIANQEKSTFEEQQRAETSRIEMEKAKGTANMQSQLASAQVGVQIKTNEAQAREQEAKGEAAYVQLTGEAEAARRQAIGLAEAKATEALGLARATGFEAQKDALGGTATAVVEGDAVQILVPQHVAVVQAVGEDPTEREPQLAQAVAVSLRARVGEREIDVHAIGGERERFVARREHGIEQVTADGADGDDA